MLHRNFADRPKVFASNCLGRYADRPKVFASNCLGRYIVKKLGNMEYRMSTMTVNIRADVLHWIEARVRSGKFASVDDYLHDLVMRDRDREATGEERIEALRLIVEDAERSGISDKTIDDIKIEGERIARDRGLI